MGRPRPKILWGTSPQSPLGSPWNETLLSIFSPIISPSLSLTLQCPSVCSSFSSLSLNYHSSHVPSSFSHLSVYPFLSLLTCLCPSSLYPLNNNVSFFAFCSLSISRSTISLYLNNFYSNSS